MSKWATKVFLLILVSSLTTFSQTDYYIGAPGTGPDGSDPHFSSLRQACEFLNNNVWEEGPIFTDNLYITSDIVEPTGVVLTAEGRPSIGTVSLSFSAMEGRSPVITFITCGSTAGTEYGWFINSFAVSISGLTLQSDSLSFKNLIPVRINGGNGAGPGVNISNCNILYKSKSVNSDSALIRCALLTGGIQSEVINNFISCDFPGVSPYTTGVYVQNLDRCIITGNDILARRIGIAWNGGFRGTEISYNRITLNEDKPGLDCYGIIESGGITGAINIIGNTITLSKNKYSANASATGISTLSDANIINNMITGFYLDNEHSLASSELCGIKANSFLNQIVYNTIKMNDILADDISGDYTGIEVINAAFLRNNIIVNEEGDIQSNCIDFSGDFLDSDYNNMNVIGDSAFIGKYQGAESKTIDEWQTQTGQEINSVSIDVFFVSADDLHLAETSIGDTRLAGIPVEGFDHDIDQELRHDLHPYMGADESNVPITPSVLSVNNTSLPGNYRLRNYPNPFNPVTKIVYNLTSASHVKLEVCSVTGETIRILVDENKNAGSYENYFTADGLASGTYIYRLIAGAEVLSRKMILLK